MSVHIASPDLRLPPWAMFSDMLQHQQQPHHFAEHAHLPHLRHGSFLDRMQEQGKARMMQVAEQAGQPRPPLPRYATQSITSLQTPPLKPNLPPPTTDTSEHILRRKTPSGTLAAGYDGTPVEWTSRPHINKHIVLSSGASGQPLYQATPTTKLESFSRHRARFLSKQESSQLGAWGGMGSPLRSDASTHQNGPWDAERSSGPDQPSMDSVLLQGLPAQQIYSPGQFHQMPTMLQPTLSPGGGPTAMNTPGPYGPYWPNGLYEPYRPAAIRDGRFHSQFASISLNDPSDEEQAPKPAQSWNAPSNEFYVPSSLPDATTWSGNQDIPPSHGKAFAGGVHPHHQTSRQAGANRLDGQQTQLRSFGPRSTLGLAQDHGQQWSSNSTSIQHGQPFHNNHLNFESSNLQFKERYLLEAHRIYANLIASIHRSRRGQNTPAHQSQAKVFPKPPSALPLASRNAGRRNSQVSRTADDTAYSSHSTPTGAADSRIACGPYSQEYHDRYERQARTLGRPATSHGAHAIETYPSSQQGPLSSAYNSSGDGMHQVQTAIAEAREALEMLGRLCRESQWMWIDGILLGGCLAYGLADYERAYQWYGRVLACDPNNVEAISNTAAVLLSLKKPAEAEVCWLRAIKLRPSYFEAVEHLVGLLSGNQRGMEAVQVIDFVQDSLRKTSAKKSVMSATSGEAGGSDTSWTQSPVTGESSSGYAVASSNHGRLIGLIHAKGNMLYAAGDHSAAAQTFEEAIIVAAGPQFRSIDGVIRQILQVFMKAIAAETGRTTQHISPCESILLLPKTALKTARLVFPPDGQLPGLRDVAEGHPRKAAVSVTSNSLLSLAKIYQDGMSTCANATDGLRSNPGIHDILALYYLSLSLSPSPSTVNNVGILLAGVQQVAPPTSLIEPSSPLMPPFPGVVAGSGVALALQYYNYGLNLDARHAHLYTNLGSLLKDIGQLAAAIKMYEQAVSCDGNFDIALANLANAVKDQGRVSDAISYYRRAVQANPDFAEAVCGLANSLNSVCSWRGRGGIVSENRRQERWHVNEQNMLLDAQKSQASTSGWIGRVLQIVEKQLNDGQGWGRGSIRNLNLDSLAVLDDLLQGMEQPAAQRDAISEALASWSGENFEGAKIVRLVERATKRLAWQMYQDQHIRRPAKPPRCRARPQLPSTLAVPSAPTVLPFHTFTYPLTAQQIRQISQRNGLRISCATLRASWLPTTMFPPPSPPNPHLNVGYVSSDFNNHPLAHLMQSVFGFHNPRRVKAFCYATTPSDHSPHREQIEREAPKFHDASAWPIARLVNQIVEDGIHILINLNGYTRGARNEVFATRPAPIQMSFMGFAGTLGAEWCDYLLCDATAIPPSTLRSWRRNVDLHDQTLDQTYGDDDASWVYSENIIYTRDTFFCCDHRQSAPDAGEAQLSWLDELRRRKKMRKELFPNLADDAVILGNFNQLYKIDPTTFRTWLRILQALPNAVLWLLRFPDLGETNLRQTALQWSSPDVAARLLFTDVAPKHQHIARARVCDLFLDTPECNAHTTAADVLWSGTPLLTFPRYAYKMCSRMAASILRGALPATPDGRRAADELIVTSDEAYEARAVELGRGLAEALQAAKDVNAKARAKGNVAPKTTETTAEQEEEPRCRLLELRRLLYEARWGSALFDTRRWVRDLEEAYEKAWERWVAGEGGDIWL